MGLLKKEILVRPNSTADFEAAMGWTIDWLNSLQDKDSNKDADGNYKDYFFADIFFAPEHFTNSGQMWRMYSDACKDKYDLVPAATGRIEFLLFNLEEIKQAVQDVEQLKQDSESNDIVATVI